MPAVRAKQESDSRPQQQISQNDIKAAGGWEAYMAKLANEGKEAKRGAAQGLRPPRRDPAIEKMLIHGHRTLFVGKFIFVIAVLLMFMKACAG